jgi:hypothetical protein
MTRGRSAPLLPAGLLVAAVLALALLLAGVGAAPPPDGPELGTPARAERRQDGDAGQTLTAFFEALAAQDMDRAGDWLADGFFAIAPWGALELPAEMLGRYREAFAAGRLEGYRVEIRALHTGPAGEGARWFRAIVREKYRRQSERAARTAFAEDLLTSGVAVQEGGRWKLRFLHQTWSEETLRRMVPILHAAQPADPEEY